MTEEFFFLSSKLLPRLIISSPFMSGSMRLHIENVYLSDTEAAFKISAPQYDMEKWINEGIIVYTGQTPDYAVWVNELGGFGSHNKSEHWVNRAVYEICSELKAIKKNVVIVNELPLNYGAGYTKRSKTEYSSKFKREVKRKDN